MQRWLASGAVVGLLAFAAPLAAAPSSDTARPAVWANPCTVTVGDPSGDARLAGDLIEEPDIDMTSGTLRLGRHRLVATITVPHVTEHSTPSWRQRFYFLNSHDEGETYDFLSTGGSRGTLPSTPFDAEDNYGVRVRWDDARGRVTLSLPRQSAVVVDEELTPTLRGVRLDLGSS